MGELVQIDGIPYDWFNDGRDYVLHLAVDDASTRICPYDEACSGELRYSGSAVFG